MQADPDLRRHLQRLMESTTEEGAFSSCKIFSEDLAADVAAAGLFMQSLAQKYAPSEIGSAHLAKYCLWKQSLWAPPATEQLPSRANTGSTIVFQYWSQGKLPDALQEVTDKWNSLMEKIGLREIELFDKIRAETWIRAFAPEFITPFLTAYHPALEADVFRLAFASRQGAFYLDVDNYPTPHSAAVISAALDRGCSALFFRDFEPRITNSLFVSAPGCPFFRMLAEAAQEIDFSQLPARDRRCFPLVGPALFNRLYENAVVQHRPILDSGRGARTLPALVFDSYEICFIAEGFAAHMKPPFDLGTVPGYRQWQTDLAEAPAPTT